MTEHEGGVGIEEWLNTNFRFADCIVVNVKANETDILVDRLDTTTTRYKMLIGLDKTKVMTNNRNGTQSEILINGHRVEAVKNSKYSGSVI